MKLELEREEIEVLLCLIKRDIIELALRYDAPDTYSDPLYDKLAAVLGEYDSRHVFEYEKQKAEQWM